MITCREAEEMIERRLDAERTPGPERALDEHLAGCPACAGLLDREAAVDAALAAHFADAEPTPQLARRVRGRLQVNDPTERLGWITDALNAVGVMAMVAIATRLAGHSDAATVSLLGVAAATVAVGLYPMLLTRSGQPGPEPPRR